MKKPRPFLLMPRSSSYSITPVRGPKGRAKERNNDLVRLVYTESFDAHPDLAGRFENIRKVVASLFPKASITFTGTTLTFEGSFRRIEASDMIVSEHLSQSSLGLRTLGSIWLDRAKAMLR